MASSLGSLEVKLGLDAADFTRGLTKAEQQAKNFADSLSNKIAVGVAKAEIAMRALGEAASFAIRAFPELIDGAAKFADLSDMTGAAAADLASLGVAAATAGVSMDSVAGATVKLTKGLTGVDDETKEAGAALKALGLNVQAFKNLDPVAQYEAISKALAGYADGAGKTAVAVALFGKAGAEQLKVMKALEDQGGRTSILTQEQIDLADEYGDRQAKSRAELLQYVQVIAIQMLPAITAFTETVKDTIKAIAGLDGSTSSLKGNTGVQDFAEGAVKSLGFIIDAADGVARAFKVVGIAIGAAAASVAQTAQGNFALAVQIGKEANDDIEEILNKAMFSAKLAENIDKQRQDFNNPKPKEPDTRPALKFNGAVKDDGGQILKKQLDARLRDIRNAAEAEKSALDYRNQITKLDYDESLIDIQSYNEKQKAIREEGLWIVLDAIDKEKAALEDYARKTKKPQDRIEAETKIADAVAKRALAVQKASQDSAVALREEGIALDRLYEQYNDFRAKLEELRGNQQGASNLKIDKEVEDARKLVARQPGGGDPSLVNEYESRLRGVAALTEAQRKYGVITDRQQTAEALIALAAQQNGQTELETLNQVGRARQENLLQLQRLADAANELAKQLGTDDARAFADRMTLAFKQAAAAVDPLLLKIRDVAKEMGGSIASGFEDAIVEGKNLREVLSGIEKDLVRIVTRNLVTQPLGDYISKMLGGVGSDGGILGSLFKGVSSGGGGSFFSGIGSWISSFFGGGMSGGGSAEPGRMYQVAENRPEMLDVNGRSFLMMGNQRGRINPNPSMGNSRTTNASITVNVPESTSRLTALQIGADVSRKLAQANFRNN